MAATVLGPASDGDDLPAGLGDRTAEPVAVLCLDLEPCIGQEPAERSDVEEAQARAIDAQHGAAGFGRRLAEGDDVTGDRLDLVPDAQRAAGRVDEAGGIRRVPLLPGARLRVARLEREPAALAQCGPDPGPSLRS
jgi:hypothetical protein